MNKLLLVLIFCLAQQTLVESFLRNMVGKFSNFTENIQAAITDRLLAVKNQVDTIVENGVESVENMANTVVDTGYQVRMVCTTLIQTAAEEAEKRIASMVEDSVKDGKDASHCIRTVTSDSIESVTNEMTSCIEENVLKCREYVGEGLERIRDLLQISEKFEGDVRSCGVGVQSVGCIGLLLTEIASQSFGIAGKATQLVKDIITYVLQFKNKFISCQTKALGSSAVEFGKFVTEAGSCIEKCISVNIQDVVQSYSI